MFIVFYTLIELSKCNEKVESSGKIKRQKGRENVKRSIIVGAN